LFNGVEKERNMNEAPLRDRRDKAVFPLNKESSRKEGRPHAAIVEKRRRRDTKRKRKRERANERRAKSSGRR